MGNTFTSCSELLVPKRNHSQLTPISNVLLAAPPTLLEERQSESEVHASKERFIYGTRLYLTAFAPTRFRFIDMRIAYDDFENLVNFLKVL